MIQIEKSAGPARSAPTMRWALTRTLIGLGLIAIFVVGQAWLLYAGIDPVEDRANEIQQESPIPDRAE